MLGNKVDMINSKIFSNLNDFVIVSFQIRLEGPDSIFTCFIAPQVAIFVKAKNYKLASILELKSISDSDCRLKKTKLYFPTDVAFLGERIYVKVNNLLATFYSYERSICTESSSTYYLVFIIFHVIDNFTVSQ